MKLDAVIKNLYEIRDAHAKSFGYKLSAIAADLREKELQSGHPHSLFLLLVPAWGHRCH